METETRWYHYIAYFFAGVFLANTIPHLVNGISGIRFRVRSPRRPGRACRHRLSTFCGEVSTWSWPTFSWLALAVSTCGRRRMSSSWGWVPC